MNIKRLQERADAHMQSKPKVRRTPDAITSHMAEELGEIVKAMRTGKIGQTYELDEFGLSHPEGLGSECADLIGLACALCEHFGIDIDAACDSKLLYLEARRNAKDERRKSRKSKKGKNKS